MCIQRPLGRELISWTERFWNSKLSTYIHSFSLAHHPATTRLLIKGFFFAICIISPVWWVNDEHTLLRVEDTHGVFHGKLVWGESLCSPTQHLPLWAEEPLEVKFPATAPAATVVQQNLPFFHQMPSQILGGAGEVDNERWCQQWIIGNHLEKNHSAF